MWGAAGTSTPIRGAAATCRRICTRSRSRRTRAGRRRTRPRQRSATTCAAAPTSSRSGPTSSPAWRCRARRGTRTSSAGCWTHRAGTLTASVLISGMGPLTEPKLPEVPGIESFEGKTMHSARWDHDYELSGKRVASIGTGRVGDPVRAGDPGEGREAVRVPAHRAVDHAAQRPADQRSRALAVSPLSRPCRSSCAALSTSTKEMLVLGFVKYPRLMGALERLSRSHMRKQVSDHELLREAHAGVRARLQAHPSVEPLVSGAAAAERGGRGRQPAGGPRALRDGRRRRSSARWTRSSSAPAFTSADPPVAEQVRGRDGQADARGVGAARRAPTWGRRFPTFPICSCCWARTRAWVTARWC